MHHEEFEAPIELQDSIKCFWYNRVDFGGEESAFEVQPDGYAEIIFYFGSTCSISINGNWQPLPSPFIMGLLNKPASIKTKNRFEIIAIRCFPWAVFDLLGLPSGKDGVHIFEHPISQLQSTLNKLIKADKVNEAVDVVRQYFMNARSLVIGDNTLSKAGTAMTTAKGTMPVNLVAEAAHTTVRTLERKFKQSSGYTVKDVSGLMRFEQVRNHLWHYPESNLAALAHDLGYTDQSHLNREFKRYSGATPAAFARKAKERKQVLGNDFAFIQI